MEVAHWQQIGLAFRQPGARCRTLALGAVPVAATVVGDAPVPAVLAGLDMTAQGSGAAVLDRGHHLELCQAQMADVGRPIGRPSSAEDVGDLMVGAHASAVWRCLRSRGADRVCLRSPALKSGASQAWPARHQGHRPIPRSGFVQVPAPAIPVRPTLSWQRRLSVQGVRRREVARWRNAAYLSRWD